jgi:hypothetical protein
MCASHHRTFCFQVRVRGVNDAGMSDWSSVSTTQVLAVPSAPRNVVIQLWGAENNKANMAVFFGRPTETGVGDSSWPLVSFFVLAVPDSCQTTSISINTTVPGNYSSALIKGLVKGCVYNISVRAQNKVGMSPEAFAAERQIALVPSTRPLSFTARPGVSQQVTKVCFFHFCFSPALFL